MRSKECGEGNEIGKAPGLDGFPMECFKRGGIAVLKWLVDGLAWRMYRVPVLREFERY